MMPMSLSDISSEYRKTADKLHAKLCVLREQLRNTRDPEEIFRLKRRINDLIPILTEIRALEELTRRYYDKDYHRDARYSSNCFKELPPYYGRKKKNPISYYTERTDGAPEGYVHQVLHTEVDTFTDSANTRCEYKYRKSYSEECRTEYPKVYEIPLDVLDGFIE